MITYRQQKPKHQVLAVDVGSDGKRERKIKGLFGRIGFVAFDFAIELGATDSQDTGRF